MCINKTGDGGAGICFIRKGPFSVTSSIMTLIMKQQSSNTNIYYLS